MSRIETLPFQVFVENVTCKCSDTGTGLFLDCLKSNQKETINRHTQQTQALINEVPDGDPVMQDPLHLVVDKILSRGHILLDDSLLARQQIIHSLYC